MSLLLLRILIFRESTRSNLRWLLTSRRSIFFFTVGLMRCPSTGIERPSRLSEQEENGLNYVLQYTSSAPSLREGRDRAQAFFSQSD